MAKKEEHVTPIARIPVYWGGRTPTEFIAKNQHLKKLLYWNEEEQALLPVFPDDMMRDAREIYYAILFGHWDSDEAKDPDTARKILRCAKKCGYILDKPKAELCLTKLRQKDYDAAKLTGALPEGADPEATRAAILLEGFGELTEIKQRTAYYLERFLLASWFYPLFEYERLRLNWMHMEDRIKSVLASWEHSEDPDKIKLTDGIKVMESIQTWMEKAVVLQRNVYALRVDAEKLAAQLRKEVGDYGSSRESKGTKLTTRSGSDDFLM